MLEPLGIRLGEVSVLGSDFPGRLGPTPCLAETGQEEPFANLRVITWAMGRHPYEVCCPGAPLLSSPPSPPALAPTGFHRETVYTGAAALLRVVIGLTEPIFRSRPPAPPLFAFSKTP